MREFVAEDSDAGGEAGGQAEREGGSDGETVGQVVDGVPQDDHHAGGRHPAGGPRSEAVVALLPLVEAVEAGHALALKHKQSFSVMTDTKVDRPGI